MRDHPRGKGLIAIDDLVNRALKEDMGPGDVTSIATIDPQTEASGIFLAKENGVLSGTWPATRAFELVDASVAVRWTKRDGDPVVAGQTVGHVSGNARAILAAERTALNILQRMSGIATMTAEMVAQAAPFGTKILDTRKTAPGLRVLDKMAVSDGGGSNHRFGLYDMILIKDNHIASSGSITEALADAADHRSESANKELLIEIEARSLDEVREIMAYWTANGVPDRILLDNMTTKGSDGRLDTSLLAQAVALIGGTVDTEASGNVDLSTVADIAAAGVDFISSGALTHSVKALDLSLKFAINQPSDP